MKTKLILFPLFFGLSLTIILLMGAGWQSATASPVSGEQPAVPHLPVAIIRYVSLDSLCGGLIPCYTIVQAAVDAVDDPGDEIRVATGTYTAVNNHGGLAQVVYISKTLTLRGGYSTDFSVWDPDIYTTTLNAESNGRVLYITGDITPTIEGMEVTNGKLTSSSDDGAGIYVSGATVVISDCRIHDNIIEHNYAYYDYGAGIALVNAHHSVVRNNYIYENGNANTLVGGGGIYVDRCNHCLLEGNEIYNNHSHRGGGMSIDEANPITIRNNSIYNNIADRPSSSNEWGGGLTVSDKAQHLTLQNNQIYGNDAGSGDGGGAYLYGNYMMVVGNDFHGNNAGDGGGLYLNDSRSSQTVTENQFHGNTASYGGGAYFYINSQLDAKNVMVSNNLFYSNTATSSGGAVYFYHNQWSADPPKSTWINNVVVDNEVSSGSQGSALYFYNHYDQPFETHLLHTTFARNRGGSSVYVGAGTIQFTNTIVYSHSVGVNNAGGAVSMTMTLWQSNTTNYNPGTVSTIGNITGTAVFDTDGYHLTAASDAIGQGIDAGVTDDIDGQPRPMGDFSDLGADEFPVSADLSLHKTGPSNSTAGQVLTYTLTVTNAATSEIMADARVVDTVEPAAAVASLSGSTPGGSCAASGAVITCTLYNIPTSTQRLVTVWVTPTATYDGILTDTATVTPTNALDPAGVDNADAVTTTVVYVPPVPDLWVSKTAPPFVEPGALLVYDLSWGNSGNATAMSVALTDTLPGGVNFITATLAPDSTDPLVWHLGNLAPGATATATVHVVVGDALEDGTALINRGEISSTTAEAITINNTDTATTTVYELGGYDLSLEKSADLAEVEVGGTIGYGIWITNTGGLPADVTLNDAIPAGTEYVPGSALASSGMLNDSNGIEWQGTLEVDESVLVTFDVEVVACEGVDCGTIRNVASAEIAGVAYVWQEQVDTIVRCPDLTIAGEGPERSPQFSDGTFKRYGVVFTYENKDDHNNPGVAHNTIVTITLPEGAQFSASNPIANYTSPDKRTKVWNLGNLAAGANGTIQVQVEPYQWLDAGYTAHAEIYANPIDECQPDQHPNQADVTTFPTKLELEKGTADTRWTVTRDPVTGDVTQRMLVEYYLRYHYQTSDPNRPPVSAYRIEDQWPGELTFERYTSAPEIVLIGDMKTLHSEQAVTPLHFESTEFLYVGDPGWLRLQGATATTVVTPGQVIVNEAEQTYETQKTQGTGTEVYTDSARVETQVMLIPPYITFPEEGNTCSGGSLEVRGTAQQGVTVNIYLDGDLEPTTLVAQVTPDAGGRFTATVIIPIVSEFTTHYLIAKSEHNGEISEASNRILLGKPSFGGWCPQRSYWEGTLKSGPNKGQDRTYYFRGWSGMRRTRGWQISGEYGFWDTQLHLYSCCTEATQAMTVTADGVVYTPSSRDGHWYHFDITGAAHNVTIASRCGDQVMEESGDILIDPDGYVFNVDKGGDYSGEGGMFAPVEAVSGVTVTCMVSMPTWGGWIPWPAHLYDDQVNPQVTDDVYPDNITTTGYYAFFTPPGHYYLDVQGIDGYQHWRSPVVEVITEIMHVNVPYTPWPESVVVSVTLTSQGISSPAITIPVGNAVEWVSMLTASDTLTDLIQWSENPILHPKSDLDPLENPRGFDAGYLEPGRVYRRQFNAPGTFTYTDANGNAGTVIVTGGAEIYLPIIMKGSGAQTQQTRPPNFGETGVLVVALPPTVGLLAVLAVVNKKKK